MKDGPLLRTKALLVLAIIVPALILFAVGCDKGETISFVNETDTKITVYTNGQLELDLEPFGKAKRLYLEFDELNIEARDPSGMIRYSEVVTWEEMKRRNWTIFVK